MRDHGKPCYIVEDPRGTEANKKAHDEGWQRWLKLLKASTWYPGTK